MRGKHTKLVTHWAAWAYREVLRARISHLVRWTPIGRPREGCTAIIGMCSRLPYVLDANLRCLYEARWPELQKVIIAVDTTVDRTHRSLFERLGERFPSIDVEVVWYDPVQAAVAERVKLPYVYSWMSWCIALGRVDTRHVLIHDYDALVFGAALKSRYDAFCRSGAKFQGVRWYEENGVIPADRLAVTFEAFADAEWLRRLKPVDLFNKIGIKEGRSIDYDTTLFVQDRFLAPGERECCPMDTGALVHPSQMIHQYTMFRKMPEEALPCFAMPMLPLFSHLGGKSDAFRSAASSLRMAPRHQVDLAGDGTRMNLARLDTAMVDWVLKQIVLALTTLGVAPDRELYDYGTALYDYVGAPRELHWRGDFAPDHRKWIDRAAESG